jgi:hypothetical protein
MITSDRIEPRRAEKRALIPTEKPSRIEDFAAEIAKLQALGEQIEALRVRLSEIENGEGEDAKRARPLIFNLQARERMVWSRKAALEDAVSYEVPNTLREAYILTLLVGHRTANAGQEESEAVERLISAVTGFLEKEAGIKAEDLGLASYRESEEWTDEAVLLRAADLIRSAKTSLSGGGAPCCLTKRPRNSPPGRLLNSSPSRRSNSLPLNAPRIT